MDLELTYMHYKIFKIHIMNGMDLLCSDKVGTLALKTFSGSVRLLMIATEKSLVLVRYRYIRKCIGW
jgi:DUF4097 and DUF4098 domain-containing protein YvlB